MKLNPNELYIKKEFVLFLKENKAFSAFKRNLKNTGRVKNGLYGKNYFHNYFLKSIKSVHEWNSNLNLLILNAFLWRYDTKIDWYKLHDKWNEYVNKTNLKELLRKNKHE